MDRLWSPWRYRYVSRITEPEGCVFCTKPGEDDDSASLSQDVLLQVLKELERLRRQTVLAPRLAIQ